jgi:uncharacterized protein
MGSVAAGGLVGGLIWYLAGSIVLAAGVGTILSVIVFFTADILAASQNASRQSGRGGWSGGSYSGGGGSSWSSGGSSSDSGGFSGGGGSFGGGGASGSW